MNIKENCQLLREEIEGLQIRVNSLHHHQDCIGERLLPGASEVHANITLAFRHVEDARMRLGKVIQALDGGISCYTK